MQCCTRTYTSRFARALIGLYGDSLETAPKWPTAASRQKSGMKPGCWIQKKIAKEVKEHSSHSSHLGQKTSYDTIAYALASVNMGQTDQSPATTCTTLFFGDSCLQGRYGFVPPSNFDSRAVGVMGRS